MTRLVVACGIAVMSATLSAASSRTCGIQEAIDALPASGPIVGGTVTVHGLCEYETPILINTGDRRQHGVRLTGDGPLSSALVYRGAGAAVLIGHREEDTLHVVVEDLGIAVHGGADGIRAVRTKHLAIENVLLDGTQAAGGDALVLDGGAAYSAFTRVLYPRIVGRWRTGIALRGATPVANNSNVVIGGTITQTAAGTGTGIDVAAGDTLSVLWTDIENWAVGTRLATRANRIVARHEANRVDVLIEPGARGNCIGGMVAVVDDRGLDTRRECGGW